MERVQGQGRLANGREQRAAPDPPQRVAGAAWRAGACSAAHVEPGAVVLCGPLSCRCARRSSVVLTPLPPTGAPSAHWPQVFKATKAAAALAAGIFHRHEVDIADVKAHMNATGVPARIA